MKREDNTLLELFRTNEQEAFRKLFVRYYEPMVVSARIYTNNDPEAEDIVQQVFIKIWERKLFKSINNSYRHYLHTSVRNACFNHISSSRTRQITRPDQKEELMVEQAIDFMLSKEEKRVFEKAYDELPVQSRKVFELVYFEGQQYKDAAHTLQLSVNTVKSHLRNALQVLRKSPVLQKYFSDRKKS